MVKLWSKVRISSSNRQCMVSVLIITELANWCRNDELNFIRGGDLNPELSIESSTLT